jgi:hypothetical protein
MTMARLTLTVNNLSPALEKQASGVAAIARALDLAAGDIRRNGGAKTSGNIIADGGFTVGSWTYTPQAAS